MQSKSLKYPLIASTVAVMCFAFNAANAQEASNACPVDGCTASIVDVKVAGDELEVTFEANFKPEMSKNHLHVWWGEQFDVKQVSNNAESVHHVEQGAWHPTDEFPSYMTQSAVSMSERGDATTLCVSPANRDHDIIDVDAYECLSIVELVK